MSYMQFLILSMFLWRHPNQVSQVWRSRRAHCWSWWWTLITLFRCHHFSSQAHSTDMQWSTLLLQSVLHLVSLQALYARIQKCVQWWCCYPHVNLNACLVFARYVLIDLLLRLWFRQWEEWTRRANLLLWNRLLGSPYGAPCDYLWALHLVIRIGARLWSSPVWCPSLVLLFLVTILWFVVIGAFLMFCRDSCLSCFILSRVPRWFCCDFCFLPALACVMVLLFSISS